MRDSVAIALILAAAYEAIPLDLSKASDLRGITGVDTTPRIVASQLLPNPFLSTG